MNGPHCTSAACPRDVGGSRCIACDPVVAGTVYGTRQDGFRFIRDRVVVREGVRVVERSVMAWGTVGKIDVAIRFGSAP